MLVVDVDRTNISPSRPDIMSEAEEKEQTESKEDVEESHPTPTPEETHPTPEEERPEDKENEEEDLHDFDLHEKLTDTERIQNELIRDSEPKTELEIAMKSALERKDIHIARLTNEITKLRGFISKRKQTYKRKRKDEGAPTRALSAYNLFIKERFAQLAQENENALKSSDSTAVLKRVPPANLVAKTGNEWKELSAEEKAKYEER
jgi:hypothetical protein